MKFSVYVPLNEDASAIDFGPDWSIRWVGDAQKVEQNELNCSSVCERDRNAQRCYCYVFFNNLVLAVPKVGHMSKSGTFPECKVVLFLFWKFIFLCSVWNICWVDSWKEKNFLYHVVTGSSSKRTCLAVEFSKDNPLLFKALHAQRELYSLCLCRFVSSLWCSIILRWT